MTSRFVAPFFDTGSGLSPSDGAKLTFKNPGLETLKNTFSDAAGLIANTNPVIADATGLFSNIYINGNYDVVLQDKNNVQIWADSVSEFALVADTVTVKNIATLALAVADTNLLDGDALNIAERTTGNGGGAMWDVVLSSTVTENTFNFVQGVGVGTLSLVLRINGETNVKSWGATGDGATDDTLALQAVFDNLDLLGGGNAYFPVGTYMISASEGVRIGGDTLIHGVKGLSILKRTPATGSKIILVAFNYQTGGLKPSQSIRNVTIRDLTFDGSAGDVGSTLSEFLHGLDIRFSGNVLVENNEFLDCPGDGVVVRHGCDNVTVQNNTFNGSKGWIVNRGGGPNVRNAIAIQDLETGLIDNNTIVDWSNPAGIDLEQDDSALGNYLDITISNNTITSSTIGFRGIQIAPHPNLSTDRAGTNIRVIGNTIDGTSDYGMWIAPRTKTGTILYQDINVEGNIFKNTWNALLCEGIERLSIENNKFTNITSNPTARCVLVNDCRNITKISGNQIGISNFTKIEVNNAQSVVAKGLNILGNTVIDTTATSGAAIDVNGFFTKAIVSSNNINTKISGIQIRGTSNTEGVTSNITGNTVVTEGFAIFTADWCEHTLIDGNTLHYTLLAGGAVLDSTNIVTGGGINFGANTFIDETGAKVQYDDIVPNLNKLNNHRLPNYNEGTQAITLASTALSALSPYVFVVAGGFSVNSIASLNRVITIIASGALTITHNATTLKLSGGVNAVMADGEAITLIRKPDLNLVELSRSF